jgi:ribonuclease VapC
MVVDSSVLLAIFFEERCAGWAAKQLAEHSTNLCMSTVNLAEVLIRAQEKQPTHFALLEAELLGGAIELVPPDAEQARIAAEARLKFPLNLGDCFAYALAVARRDSILTLDSDFRGVDVPVVLP